MKPTLNETGAPTMDIAMFSLLDGARAATGSVAIIDVFRAFTTAAVALANGASRIVMVAGVEEAIRLRDQGIGHLCMGEVRGRKPESFDFGNSPYAIATLDFSGKTIIQRTSAGTQGIVAATKADRLYAASLVTASATARALRRGDPERVSLVAMGNGGAVRTDEDELCALHLRNLLEGRFGHPAAVRDLILSGGDAARFRDPERAYLDSRDLDIALDIDRYAFATRVTQHQGLLQAQKEV